MAKRTVAAKRHDAVLIRVSTQGQDDKPQIANCKNMLAQRGIEVPTAHWYRFRVSRRRVLTGADFEQVMEEVRAGKIRDIYVESQDRFGGKSNKELFSVLKVLQDHDTRLFDLTNSRELTSDEFIDEIQTLFEGMKSVKELKDTSRRSIRSRVNNFKASGSWPTGAPPLGYGKRCVMPDGATRFEWYPTTNRAKGEAYYPNSSGKLSLSHTNTGMPRKEREDKIFLVPHRNKKIVKCVQMIFDLFANHGMSQRGISIRLNELGFKNYEKPFTFVLVGQLLKNRAYIGDTIFGKNQTGAFHSFDAEGNIIETTGKDIERNQSQKIVKTATHSAIIDRKAWDRVQARFARESEESKTHRKLPPLKSEFYLKNLLVCGHCGRGMTGRTETGPGGKVKYVCASYNSAKSNGQKTECGFQTITHELAEQLIFEKLGELGIKSSEVTGKQQKKAVKRRLKDREREAEASDAEFFRTVQEGVTALMGYLKANYDLTTSQKDLLNRRLEQFYTYGLQMPRSVQQTLPIDYTEVKAAVRDCEREAVKNSAAKLAKVKKEHDALTLKWALAPASRAEAMNRQLEAMETQMAELEQQSKTVSERLQDYWDSMELWREDQESLLEEFHSMDARIKGETLRRIIESVTLTWEKKWHEAETKPSREKTTKRNGRWEYVLKRQEIVWKIRGLDANCSW